ncbi:MAG: hypothetical protein SNJ73_05855, partial [Acetobacteraceae bacterium]
MRPALAPIVDAVLPVAAGLLLARRDRRADRTERARLAARQPAHPERFSPETVATRPEPARRHVTFAILPGTPLRRMAEHDTERAADLAGADDRDAHPAICLLRSLARREADPEGETNEIALCLK